jgi:hypothetical protein
MHPAKDMCIYFQILKFQTSTTTQYFWEWSIVIISEDINIPEMLNWKITLALLVVWVLVYMCMITGIVCSGKVN